MKQYALKHGPMNQTPVHVVRATPLMHVDPPLALAIAL
jgi:hypothetical protein